MGALYNGGLLVALGISAGTVLAAGLRSERYDVRQGGACPRIWENSIGIADVQYLLLLLSQEPLS